MHIASSLDADQIFIRDAFGIGAILVVFGCVVPRSGSFGIAFAQ